MSAQQWCRVGRRGKVGRSTAIVSRPQPLHPKIADLLVRDRLQSPRLWRVAKAPQILASLSHSRPRTPHVRNVGPVWGEVGLASGIVAESSENIPTLPENDAPSDRQGDMKRCRIGCRDFRKGADIGARKSAAHMYNLPRSAMIAGCFGFLKTLNRLRSVSWPRGATRRPVSRRWTAMAVVGRPRRSARQWPRVK